MGCLIIVTVLTPPLSQQRCTHFFDALKVSIIRDFYPGKKDTHSRQTRAEHGTKKSPQIKLPKGVMKKYLPRQDEKWLGIFSHCQRQAQVFFWAKFGAKVGKILGLIL